ncbi:MAG: NfeD family protein [Planctomycetota bacterium]
MEANLYTICAVGGGVLVLVQVVLQTLGLFGEADIDMDGPELDTDGDPVGHGNVFFGVLSFKALCAFAAIFGLVGLIMMERSPAMPVRLAVATGSGVAGMFAVGLLMRGLANLQSSGTVRIENAVGKSGTCYLRIPGAHEGLGKVTIEIQGRSLEFPARTDGDEIPSGARIRVVSVEGDQTLDVIAI